MHRASLALLLLSLWLLPASVAAERIEGRVVAISDGDTLTVLTAAKQQVKVRLAEIDTPESRQPYGTRARQQLSNLVFNLRVQVEVTDTDRYGRKVGRVHAAGRDVNAELVRLGAAWVYREYNFDRSLLAVEEEARAARRGLWGLPEAERTPPWEWRQAARGQAPKRERPAAATPRRDAPAVLARRAPATELACAGKRTCGQTAGCEEARFYLAECGLRRLDGDSDGVPCEKLCR